jgi:hypothetical protein
MMLTILTLKEEIVLDATICPESCNFTVFSAVFGFAFFYYRRKHLSCREFL